MNLVTRVQILDEAVCISLCTDGLFSFLMAYQTGVFNAKAILTEKRVVILFNIYLKG